MNAHRSNLGPTVQGTTSDNWSDPSILEPPSQHGIYGRLRHRCYDFHVDLSGATGNAEGRVLDDYDLVLEQDFTGESLFGVLGSDPVQLPLDAEPAGACSTDTFDDEELCQQSWNPGFGNDDFDPGDEGTYNLRLVLTPETFDGPPLAVAIQVNVTED